MGELAAPASDGAARGFRKAEESTQMIRHRHRNSAAVLQVGPPAMQRRPEPQTAFGVLPAQAASLQAPQISVAKPGLWLAAIAE